MLSLQHVLNVLSVEDKNTLKRVAFFILYKFYLIFFLLFATLVMEIKFYGRL